MTPSFIVPAEYFYVLGADLPLQVDAETRYQLATLEEEETTRDRFLTAVDTGVIDVPVRDGDTIVPEQAARRLSALGRISGGTETQLADPSDAFSLVEAWLDSQEPEIGDFWATVPGNTDLAEGHLYLLMLAIIKHDPAPLIAALKAQTPPLLPSPASVTDLQDITKRQWKDFFSDNPTLLPPFTAPGTL